MVPTVEIHVTGQRSQVIKEGLTGRQVRSQQLVLLSSVLDVWKWEKMRQVPLSELADGFRTCSLSRLWQR